MHELLNVLYVQTQGALLHLENDTVRVVVAGETKLRVPLLRLNGLVLFGQVSITPFLIHRCAQDGRALVWLDRNGRFKARVEGHTRGNVLLRRAQHLALSDSASPREISQQIVAAKIQNCRQLMLRSAREGAEQADQEKLAGGAERLYGVLQRVRGCKDLDQVRGAEGEAAREYFHVFGSMLRGAREGFAPDGRTRRPPRDRMNCLLSFLYSLLRGECASALEGVGLDPQVGYLHSLRPGRPALALDLMEELRPVIADRLAITLVNRRQLREEHFEEMPGGAVYLSEEGRKAVIVAYQQRKEEVLRHRVLKQKLPLGLVPHVQARLLARHLRGDLQQYPPFLYR